MNPMKLTIYIAPKSTNKSGRITTRMPVQVTFAQGHNGHFNIKNSRNGQ